MNQLIVSLLERALDIDVVATVARADAVYLPFIVIAELRAGFALGSQTSTNRTTLSRLLSKPGVEVLWPQDSTTHVYASLYRQLRQQGTPIPTNDMWIASLVVERGLSLYSRDAHFRRAVALGIRPSRRSPRPRIATRRRPRCRRRSAR